MSYRSYRNDDLDSPLGRYDDDEPLGVCEKLLRRWMGRPPRHCREPAITPWWYRRALCRKHLRHDLAHHELQAQRARLILGSPRRSADSEGEG